MKISILLNWNCHKQADDMAKALGEILKKARGWDKYDERSAIPTDEIRKE